MSALKYFFGVVARPQTWLDYVYLWLAFPLGLFYFIFLVVGLSVGLSLVIIWVGIPMLLLVAGAWYLFAAFERVLARELLRAPIAPAPRAWEAVDGVWNKLKAHFASGSTWKDLVFLLARLPIGIVSFTIVTTQAGLAVAFIGAPFFQRFDALWIGGQRIDSPGVAFALVPVGVLVVIALFHVIHGWAWLCGKLATALFGDGRVAPPSAQAAPPAWAQPPQSPQPPQGPQYPQPAQYPQPPQYAQPPQYPQDAQAPVQQGPQAPQYAQSQLPPGLKYRQPSYDPQARQDAQYPQPPWGTSP
ncbi:MAG: sensor domain-containing protein, partial [Thermoleophilia bacterium]|nr:sensor domain-containing protein [Thermoleophilia bacterium]